MQLESYLPKKYNIPIAPLQKLSLQIPLQENSSADNSTKKHTKSTVPYKPSADNSKLALANVKTDTKKLNERSAGAIWDILMFMDTGGQPQFISMLPAVNSFAMITFIVHKLQTGGLNSLNKTVKVQYGNKKGEVSIKPHPHNYTYLQFIETLISYSSNILSTNTSFLDKVKIESKEYENTRSIVLTGTHSGDDQLSEDDIKEANEELTKIVNKSGVNHIKPQLNKNYQFLVPIDNKKQGKNSTIQVTEKDKKSIQILLMFAGIYRRCLVTKIKSMFLLNGYYLNLKYEKFVNKGTVI